ncbi:hypothetical protein [Micromonospora sp. WMMA1976]|uniref:hypothetical protein n=1 Tax=Micromonospora sp. WMMA1976 TaxID=3014995 RepID=UPI00248C9E15|nr:hypothetical protein [Micromonospora sp. WMMA1976]WBC04261.1 hypothetical protein O7546_04600 [Micromonospora sp. WMMA1976]
MEVDAFLAGAGGGDDERPERTVEGPTDGLLTVDLGLFFAAAAVAQREPAGQFDPLVGVVRVEGFVRRRSAGDRLLRFVGEPAEFLVVVAGVGGTAAQGVQVLVEDGLQTAGGAVPQHRLPVDRAHR